MPIFDTHAHIDHLEDWQTSLKEAYSADVHRVMAMSMNLESCRKNLDIVQEVSKQNEQSQCLPSVHLAMGMHPCDVDRTTVAECLALMRDKRPLLTAVGEIGLDFWYKWVRKDKEKKDEQREVFRTFLKFGVEEDLPVVIHSRGAWRECLDIVHAEGVKKAEFHWYSGPLDVLEDLLAEGYYVSTTPSVAYSPQSKDAMVAAPLERTLIETDCPVTYRNKESGETFAAQPKDVWRTLEAYCSLKGMDKEAALPILNGNALTYFNIET